MIALAVNLPNEPRRKRAAPGHGRSQVIMSFALENVKSVALELVREYQPSIQIVAVMPSEGGADSAELIVARESGDVRLVCLHVSRAGSGTDLRAAIAQALARRFGPARAAAPIN